MYISNYLDGQNVDQVAMDNEFVALNQKTNFLDNLIPCVYYGLKSTNVTGLSVTIANGEGRVKDVSLYYVCSGNAVAIECNASLTILTIPANSTGYIVVNSNINSLSSGFYEYFTTDTISFVSTLTNTFPSGTLLGQIVLYYVTSTAIGCTLIIDGNCSTRLAFYNPDIIDDISTGNVTIGGRIPSGSFTTSTKDGTGVAVHFFSNTSAFISQIGFYATGTDGVTANSGIQCKFGSRPFAIGDLSTLSSTSGSVAFLRDIPVVPSPIISAAASAVYNPPTGGSCTACYVTDASTGRKHVIITGNGVTVPTVLAIPLSAFAIGIGTSIYFSGSAGYGGSTSTILSIAPGNGTFSISASGTVTSFFTFGIITT